MPYASFDIARLARRSATVATLTANQLEVLRDLARLLERPDLCSRRGVTSTRCGIARSAWATPLDFGGRSRSHHSATAKRLAQMGLVDRYNYHTDQLNNFAGCVKGACVYRITKAGLAALGRDADAVAAAALDRRP